MASFRTTWLQLKKASIKERVLLAYYILVISACLFVPCYAIRESEGTKLVQPVGYTFLWSVPPFASNRTWIVEIDIITVILEVGALTGLLGLVLLLIQINALRADEEGTQLLH